MGRGADSVKKCFTWDWSEGGEFSVTVLSRWTSTALAVVIV